ncbi:MAG: hypothetical protein AAF677_08605 [Pseudomonadota bacterium]
MPRLPFALALALALSLAAMSHARAQQPTPPDGGVIAVATADEGADGTCRPSWAVAADTGATGLYSVRGEIVYRDAETAETTSIPLQHLFPYPDDAGIARDRSIVVINSATACAALRIEITVEHCTYQQDRPAERACPPNMMYQGGGGFAAIEVTREDKGL